MSRFFSFLIRNVAIDTSRAFAGTAVALGLGEVGEFAGSFFKTRQSSQKKIENNPLPPGKSA